MSLAATFPNLLEMEQKFGSLVRGFLDQRKKVEEMKKKHPPKPGAKPRTFFSSFVDGMQHFTDSLAAAIGPERIRTDTAVVGIDRRSDGSWLVTLDSGETLEGAAVIVATEVWAAEKLVRTVDERIADVLSEIPCSSSATVPMAFRAEDCPFDTKWFGILSPLVEHRPLLAVTLSSSKWPDRAPEDKILLRGFVGGPRNQHQLAKSDEELTEVVRQQLVELLGIRADAQPVFSRVFRWKLGMPQYTLGHLDRVDEIEQRTAAIAGLGLAGGGYRGVGIPNCLESGERAVRKVLGELGIELAEDAQMEPRV